ncbi:GerAB/ArcD/ProY family transporter [Paenibacillus radicis (ex Gao et al. 2016)]|uniref:Germination protein n=1 Tax=Paenibacillus radicis (ex Gao et al. 2016) TaxID=1737354 RepID=A0A917M2X1_9BACL|nr:endospore germination permease [Paenibacillus radicis (ex Gao et al. 2016)]GGG71580.1 germination protein [Paenibacillus radicis (ex Gao et al. 2016)]
MEKKSRISAAQLCLLMYLASSGTGLMSSPSVAASFAGLDMWIAPFWGLIGGIACLWIMIQLHRLYPGQNLIQYAEAILGRIAGKAISFLFLFFVLFTTGYVIRQMTDFLSNSFFPRTPPLFLGVCIVFVCAAAVNSGIEVICRLPVLFFPFPILMMVVIFVPLFPDLKPVLPIFEHGILPSFWGGCALQLWYAVFCFATFYIPNVHNQDKLMRWSMLSPILLCLLLAATNWSITSILGDAASMYHYPFLVITRFVSFSEFFEHLESIVMMIWVVAFALRIMYGYYCAAVGLAQWLKLPDYRPLIWPVGMLLLLMSVWDIKTTQFAQFDSLVFPAFYALCGIGLPFLLLVAAWVRKGMTPASQHKTSNASASPQTQQAEQTK